MSDSLDISRRDFLKLWGTAAGGVATGAVLAGVSGAGRASPATEADETGLSFSPRVDTRMTLNGRPVTVNHEARTSLLDLLRERLLLTGTKKGCNEGACGACTVLLDGQRINACMTLAAACDGREVTTVEGLAAADGMLDAVQQAFVDQDAFQCGYCTPGQIVSAVACVREGHTGSRAEIAEWMSGNLCRCAAYPQIVAAVEQAAGMREG